VREDTIAAIITPAGEGAVGIIRISGDKALLIAQKIFRPAKAEDIVKSNYKLHYGHILSEKGEVIDEVLLSVMHAPHTYTREDVVEINCHGGFVSLRESLRAVLAAGARMAEPGEFTKRAFLNGRIDLSQAESVIDIIRSKTETSLKVAVSQLAGGLSSKIAQLREKMIGILAGLEAAIDFPEDEIEESTREEMSNQSKIILQELNDLIDNAARGKVYREGIVTVIAGRPNVGKSSLLNALLGEERAIVTQVPGTTRDVIEETINIKGIPLRLTDTAGLREADDLVEKIGVKKTRDYLAGAGLVLYVTEACQGLMEEDMEILKTIDKEKIIIIFNKIDIIGAGGKKIKKNAKGYASVRISALTGEGIPALKEIIGETAGGGKTDSTDSIIVSNVRHEEILRRSRGCLLEFIEGLSGYTSWDLLAVDARNALEALGEITGSTVSEDLLDRIFTDFCIGK